MNKQIGLSLVELLIALSVMGIALGALVSSQIFSFRVTKESQQTSLAKDIASQQMEKIRGYGYGSYANCPGTAPGSSAPACSGSETVSNYSGYTLSWNITNSPAAGLDLSPPPIVGVTVTVSWDDESYILSTYLSCADAGDFSSTNVPCPIESMR
jgi:type II secretory pathway pseudopilin PulG